MAGRDQAPGHTSQHHRRSPATLDGKEDCENTKCGRARIAKTFDQQLRVGKRKRAQERKDKDEHQHTE
jgi:hypothetical protein